MSYCSRPEGDHLVVKSNSTYYPVGSALFVSCQDGYYISGSRRRLLTCDLGGTWSPDVPECTERNTSSAIKNNAVIIAVCVVACLIALGIIGMTVYIMLKNCKRDRQVKQQQEAHRQKMLDISQYFATSQDFVGMPPLTFDNIDTDMRGRSHSGSTLSNPSSPCSTNNEGSSEKVFIY